VPTGFSEALLNKVVAEDSPRLLYDSSAYLAGLAQKWNGHTAEKHEIKAGQMFCEVRIGQLLGPNPGQGARTDLQDNLSHAISDLPQPRIVEFRRYFGHFDRLIEAIRGGKRSRRSLLYLIDLWEADQRPEPQPENLDIRPGDFREALADIEPETITLILTDPPYPTEYLPLWTDLAEWATKRLIPGGSLIAYCGQSILPDALNRLSTHLRYWWTFALIHRQSQPLPGKWVSAGWKPLPWFVNECRATEAMLPDTLYGTPPRKTIPTGDDGTWAQSVDELAPIISGLTAPDDLIVDPFAGSGTVGIAATRFGRRFIGAEINLR
jgi:hypothetical protein